MIEVIPVEGLPEIEPGTDLAASIVGAAPDIKDGDVLVVTQKVVSKAENRFAPASEKAIAVANGSRRTLRRTPGGMTIAETQHGLVCANAGVDESNVPGDRIVLLPIDPDASARRIRARVAHLSGRDVAVVISDTFGRAWRLGQTDVAIGVAGIDPFLDHTGSTDMQGRPLRATRICIADELAGAADLVMGKTSGICAAIVRGVRARWGRGAATDIVRSPEDDLFR